MLWFANKVQYPLPFLFRCNVSGQSFCSQSKQSGYEIENYFSHITKENTFCLLSVVGAMTDILSTTSRDATLLSKKVRVLLSHSHDGRRSLLLFGIACALQNDRNMEFRTITAIVFVDLKKLAGKFLSIEMKTRPTKSGERLEESTRSKEGKTNSTRNKA